MIAETKVVWDVLAGLIGGYESGKKKLFESHVEPLHLKVLAIHQEYITGFEETKRHLEDDTKPPEYLIKFLEERRRGNWAERDGAANLANALATAERRAVKDAVWEDIKEYCEAISDYLTHNVDLGAVSWYSDFIDNVKFKAKLSSGQIWDAPFISGNPRIELLQELRSILDVRLPRALSRINKSYSVLRTNLL